MAKNFLYMFEFVVDDLLITRPNDCAPENFPTCCDITFRNSIYISICDRQYGQNVDANSIKCGKCVVFTMESPITDKDRLLVHCYKKKNHFCKFLIGMTELPIQPLFQKVTDDFNIQNEKWKEKIDQHIQIMPDPKDAENYDTEKEIDYDLVNRGENFCPSSELTKRLLPIFNTRQEQTGNLVLIMRLVCNGPAIVTSFPYCKICASCCTEPCPKPCESPCDNDAEDNDCDCEVAKALAALAEGCNDASDPMECQGPCSGQKSKSKKSRKRNCGKSNPVQTCIMDDPCDVPTEKPMCRRYFACNSERTCPCNECKDYFN